MKTKNYNFVAFIILGLFIALIAFITTEYTNYKEAESLINLGLSISEVAGFIMLVRNGTFIKTRFFRFFKLAFAVVLIGALFKILHYPYGNEIVAIGLICIIIVYTFSFLNKPIKKRLDIIKLIWVVVAYTNTILVFLHLIGDDYRIISASVLWLAVIEYMKQEQRQRRLFE